MADACTFMCHRYNLLNDTNTSARSLRSMTDADEGQRNRSAPGRVHHENEGDRGEREGRGVRDW